MNEADKRARNRFALLNLARLIGLASVLVGIAIHYRKLALPEPAAYVFVVLGLIGFFFLPNFLARKWRTPDA